MLRRSAWILMLLAPLMAWSQEQRPEISIFKKEVHEVTAGQPVMLQDIGEIRRVSPDVAEELGQVSILDSQYSGETKTYTNLEVVRALKSKVGLQKKFAGYNFVYFVPDQIQVRAEKNKISEVRVRSQILSQLRAKCQVCEFQIRDLKIPTVDDQADMYSYEMETSGIRISGGFLVPVRVHFESHVKTIYVTGALVTKSPAMILSRSVTTGEKIDLRSIRNESVDVNFSQESFATASDLEGYVAIRPMIAGKPILKSDLKKEIYVLRGQIVRALSGNSTFEVQGQMQAEESGSMGDQIKLKNPETQKWVTGQVVDRGVVRVE